MNESTYINLLESVISALATSAKAMIASSVGPVPPSPSSTMNTTFKATKPNAIGSSVISCNSRRLKKNKWMNSLTLIF